MTYKEAWKAIYFRHCEETCDYAYMDNCQEGKCEYYMALQALNRQYYAECGSVWTKPLADRKDEPTISKMEQVETMSCQECKHFNGNDGCDVMTSPTAECKYEPQTETEIAREIVHKMIDNAIIAEDAYPNLRQRLHDAVDEYEPQTDCAWRKDQ